jgi:hypothetical protein
MSVEPSGEVPVTFAKGVLDDVAELTAASPSDEPETTDVEALKLRIAELLVECKANPFLGEPMGGDSIPSWRTAGGSASTFPRSAASLGSA